MELVVAAGPTPKLLVVNPVEPAASPLNAEVVWAVVAAAETLLGLPAASPILGVPFTVTVLNATAGTVSVVIIVVTVLDEGMT